METIHCAPYVIGQDLFIIEDGAIVTDEGVILDIGTRAECLSRHPASEQKVYPYSVIAPGFVNAHMHLYGVLAHGLAPPVPIASFESFLQDYWWPLVENRIDIPMVQAATEESALQLLDSGVTAICDVLEAPYLASEGLYCEAEVLRRLPMRCTLSIESSQRISTAQGKESLKQNAAFFESLSTDPLVSSMLCLHTAFTCSRTFIAYAKDLAHALDADIQLHLNESSYEPQWCIRNHGMRTALWYERIELLSNRLLAAQCVQLSRREIELLALRNVRTVHLPISNCEVGGGIAPAPDLLEHHVVMGLGTDGYVNNFFEVMRAAFLIHKGNRQTAQIMPARDVWRMATEGGAQAVYGASSPVGALAVGQKADFQVISLADIPTPVDTSNLFEQLILFGNPKDVIDVYVEGKAVKHNRELVCGDWEAAKAAVRMQAVRLRSKAYEP